MRKSHLLLLSILSGLLLSASWPMQGFPGLIFIAFVPLLLVEDHMVRHQVSLSRLKIMGYAYLSFFLFNLLTTWWIANSTLFGATMAILFNALFMAITFLAYHIVRRNVFSRDKGHFILVFFWMTWEYLHLDWDLSWSWLNLGNVFASRPSWVQWYEYTGAFGGTAWILLLNLLIFWVIRNIFLMKRPSAYLWASGISALALLILPLAWSIWTYHHYIEEGQDVEVVVVQPNIDPYAEQYELEIEEVVRRNLVLAQSVLDSTVDFVVCPESALQENIWEGQEEHSLSINLLRHFLLDYPGLKMVIGASTYTRYLSDEERTHTARWHRSAEFWYDAHNASLYLESGRPVEYYHKSVLVPGVEKMPFRKYLTFMEKFAIDLGGTVGSIGPDPVRKVINPLDGTPPISSAICYESAYGEFFSKFVRNGAEVVFVITNDGWWGHTPGHRQHLGFSSLRSIETRRSIARSANTGISCFVNQKGEILQATTYWTPDVIRQSIKASEKKTFYVRHGDYLARISAFTTAMFLLIGLIQGILKRRDPLRSKA